MAHPTFAKRTWNIFIRLFFPLVSSTIGRIYWASRFTWLSSGVRIDKPWKVKLGKSCLIDKGVALEAWAGKISISDRVYIGCYSVILGSGCVDVGADVVMGAHCLITSGAHNYTNSNQTIWEQGVTRKKVTIGNDVLVGAGSRIMPGVNIGNGAVIGVGSIVMDDVPEYGIAVGIPARTISYRR